MRAAISILVVALTGVASAQAPEPYPPPQQPYPPPQQPYAAPPPAYQQPMQVQLTLDEQYLLERG